VWVFIVINNNCTRFFL